MGWSSTVNAKRFHPNDVNSKAYWNCTTWRFIRRYRCTIKKLKTMVKRSLDQKHRLRNLDARHGKIESGAVVKNRKGSSGVQGGKGTCHQWKEKGQCSQGDRCSFRHESQDRAQNPEHKAATLSEASVSRGRSVSRKRSIRGKSNPGIILRQPCWYYLKGACTRSPCEYSHPPECQFFKKNETGCKAGDKCLFPHYRVMNNEIKSQKRAISPKRCGHREKCTTIGFCITRFRCTRFSR